MRHRRTESKIQPHVYNEKLVGAISRMLAADTDEERDEVIAENPILLTPEALELIDQVIADFDENVTVVKDFPLEWKRLRKFLGARQKINP